MARAVDVEKPIREWVNISHEDRTGFAMFIYSDALQQGLQPPKLGIDNEEEAFIYHSGEIKGCIDGVATFIIAVAEPKFTNQNIDTITRHCLNKLDWK